MKKLITLCNILFLLNLYPNKVEVQNQKKSEKAKLKLEITSHKNHKMIQVFTTSPNLYKTKIIKPESTKYKILNINPLSSDK